MSAVKELDEVVLLRDFPDQGLQAGDVGTAVLLHADGSAEIEVVLPSGETHALVTAPENAFRPLGPRDIPHARTA